MTIESLIKECSGHMDKIVQHLEVELTKVRAGKITPNIIDGLSIDYYGTQTPINQVANVAVADARTLTIQPWEKKNLELIDKAIQAANLGINPHNDGNTIKLFMPPPTEERRKEYVKKAYGMAEAARVSIRNIRRDTNEHIRKLAKEHVPEDAIKDGEAKVQELTNKFSGIVEKHIEVKEKEIMTV